MTTVNLITDNERELLREADALVREMTKGTNAVGATIATATASLLASKIIAGKLDTLIEKVDLVARRVDAVDDTLGGRL